MSEKNIIQALIAARKEFKPVIKDKENNFFKRKYADLENYIEATKDALCAHGLIVVQTLDERGLVTTIHHAESEKTIHSLAMFKDTKTPQEFGSQLTYLRRYSYAAILGLASEDDDANEASKTDPKPETKKEQSKELRKLADLKDAVIKSPLVGEKLIEFIRKAKANLDSKYSHAVDYKECVAWMNEKIIQLEGEKNESV